MKKSLILLLLLENCQQIDIHNLPPMGHLDKPSTEIDEMALGNKHQAD